MSDVSDEKPRDGITQAVGYCHVGDPDAINREETWVCADNCPHPDHAPASDREDEP